MALPAPPPGASAAPDSPDPRLLEKLRWQSRRGTLELDLILEKFWRGYSNCNSDGGGGGAAGRLDAAGWAGLQNLLALDDEDLYRAIKSGGAGLPPAECRVAKILRDQ